MDEKIFELIIKHLKGQSSEEDSQLILNWLHVSIENRRLYDELNDIWQSTAKRDEEIFDGFNALKKVRGKISQGEAPYSIKTQSSLIKILKIAAVVVLAFIIGVLSNHFFSRKVVTTDNAITEIEAPMGSKSKITNIP